jgi:hypothetical protein
MEWYNRTALLPYTVPQPQTAAKTVLLYMETTNPESKWNFLDPRVDRTTTIQSTKPRDDAITRGTAQRPMYWKNYTAPTEKQH